MTEETKEFDRDVAAQIIYKFFEDSLEYNVNIFDIIEMITTMSNVFINIVGSEYDEDVSKKVRMSMISALVSKL